MQLKSFIPKAIFVLGLALAAHPATAGDKPWQASLSISPTKGLLAIGRDIGRHYVGAGIHGIVFSARNGFEISPSIAYQHRLSKAYLPYLGVSTSLTYNNRDNTFRDPIAMPALGYEWRLRHIYLHAEAFAATPINTHFARTWSPGAGVGLGLPF